MNSIVNNSQVIKNLFANYKKGAWGREGNPLPFSASDLFEERTMESFY
jgi:hypothetical protein